MSVLGNPAIAGVESWLLFFGEKKSGGIGYSFPMTLTQSSIDNK